MKRLRLLALLPLCAALCACDWTVLNPSGDIAVQQRDLLVISTVLMLLIIIPVMVLIVLFAWRYRHSNTQARYEPDWHHSMRLELVIWSAPLLIIICLGALTWLGTHLLDPYRPLDRIRAGEAVPQDARAVEVNVVALDWKWLFIYPQFGIASANELVVPVNRPLSRSPPCQAAVTAPLSATNSTTSSPLERRSVSIACCGVCAIGPATLKDVLTDSSAPI